MTQEHVTTVRLADMPLFKNTRARRTLINLTFEITARCPNDCRHCYINLPAGDREAKRRELSLEEIDAITDEALELGTLWVLLTGGDPLLRKDFADIYLLLKRKGFLVEVFTAGTLINREHVDLFKQYPPRSLETTVYGVTRETYERVSRKPGSFDAFMQGLERLWAAGLKVNLKTVALRSNLHEMPAILEFCREHCPEDYRLDDFLHLRYDGDPKRNEEIKSERLTTEEIIALDKTDPKELQGWKTMCGSMIFERKEYGDHRLFKCGAGMDAAVIGYDGVLRPCDSLVHPDFTYDLRRGNLTDAWINFVPRMWEAEIHKQEFEETCGTCSLRNICMWCPARAHLETGELDAFLPEFCTLTHARVEAFGNGETAEADQRSPVEVDLVPTPGKEY